MPFHIPASWSARAAARTTFAFSIAFAGFVILLAIPPRTAHAQTIAQYTFTFSSLAATNTAAHITAGDIDFTDADNIIISGSNDLEIYVLLATPTDPNGAVAANTYFQFQITPTAGYGLNLTSLTFDAAKAQGAVAGYVVRSSVDNYATNLGTGSVSSSGFSNFSTTLSSASLQSLTNPINFRIYTYGTSGAGGVVPAIRYDNITLNGTVSPAAAAEPASLPLLGMGVMTSLGAGIIGTVKRRKVKLTVTNA